MKRKKSVQLVDDDGDPLPEPFTIGPQNCESMTGMSWEKLLEFCFHFGVPMYEFDDDWLIPWKDLKKALDE